MPVITTDEKDIQNRKLCKRIKENEYYIICLKYNDIQSIKDFKKMRLILKSNEYYCKFYNMQKLIGKLKLKLKYENYMTFRLIRLIKK